MNYCTVTLGSVIYVGGLGECTVTEFNNSDGIEVTRVKEEDGTISWQLRPDENSDIALETVKVIPKESVDKE